MSGSSSNFWRGTQGAGKGLTVVTKVGMRTGLPLVPCPKCGDEVVELRASDFSKIPGQIFFKCRLHEKDVPGTCPFYLLAEKYEKFLQNYGSLGQGEVEVGRQVGMKIEQTMPNLAEKVGRLQSELGHVQEEVEALQSGLAFVNADVQGLKNALGDLDVKCTKMMNIGQLGLICQLVVGFFVILGVLVHLVK